MKTLFTFLFIAFSSLVSLAQETGSAVPEFDRARDFGLKGGVNFASVSGLVNSGFYFGMHGGVFGEVRASETFGYGAELLFNNQGVTVNNIDFGFNYLSLPVMVHLHSGKATFQAGGYGAMLLKANVRQFREKKDVTNKVAPADCGIFLGFKLQTTRQISLGARYYLGLLDLNRGLAEPRGTILENRNLQLSLSCPLN